MPNIKPISDLRNYTEVLKDCTSGEPVFLTKNGRGKYVLIDIQDYEKQKAFITLLSRIAEGEASVKSPADLLSLEEVMNRLGIEP
jgi:antitoxin Phd